MYKKILVPLDGSHRSMAAATHAVQIASKLNSTITFFHVVPNITPYGGSPGTAFKAISKEFEAMGESILNDAETEFKGTNVAIEKKLAWGKPEQEICEEAREGQYDLIVIGSRGLGEIKGYLMGSVSNRVSRHAPCPVLIVR